MKHCFSIVLMLPLLVLLGCQPTQKVAQKKNNTTPLKDSTTAKAKPKPVKGAPKPYKEVITDKAITQEGLMTVHQVGAKYYFEIPFDLLEREILVVSRISGYVKNISFGGAGMKSRPQQVIRWQRMDDRFLLRSVSHHSVANEEEPIYKSLKTNNFEPIVHSFPVAAYQKDSSGEAQSAVIDVTAFFTSDVAMIGGLYDGQRKRFGISLWAPRVFLPIQKCATSSLIEAANSPTMP